MRQKSMILLVLALGCGLVASIGISQVLSHNRDSAPAVEKEPILVAASDIKVNDPLSEKNLKLEEWPKEKIPPDAVRDLKEVAHQRAGSTILSGEPIRKAKFAEDKRLEEIPIGFLVVGVPVTADSAAGNLLQPGDHVDVLLSVKPSIGIGQQPHVAKTILQNIKVFAVNEQWRPAEGKNKSDDTIMAKTVSLLVTKPQAEVLTLANEMGGKIRLALRNTDDERTEETAGTDEEALLHGGISTSQPKASAGGGILDWLKRQSTPPAPVAAAPAPSTDEHFSMELMEGTDTKTVDFARKGDGDRWTSLAAPGSPGSSLMSGSTPPTPAPPSSPIGPNL